MEHSGRRRSHLSAVNIALAFGVVVVAALVVFAFLGPLTRSTPSSDAFVPLPAVTMAAPLRVAFLGDSLTTGGKSGVQGAKWPAILAGQHGWTTHLAARDGTGFLSTGQEDKHGFSSRVGDVVASAPDIVIVAGGMNDVSFTESNETMAASTVLRSLHQQLLKAKIVMIGPLWTQQHTDPRIDGIRAALQTAASDTGVMWVDTTGWFDGRPNLIASDGVHPTDEGHRYLAGKIDAALFKLGVT
jgi:lysophospholipase L1-like esterase